MWGGAPKVFIEFNEQLSTHIAERSAHLGRVSAELKTELFGIDDVIDQVIDAVRAWYVLPEIITRPVIVNLWGLTGTCKTQLTRSLAKKLGFYDRLIEVQMDGFSNGGGEALPC
jgi:cell division protease FtsH